MSVDDVLARLEAQRVVFAPQPSRAGLRSVPEFAEPAPLAVRVHRNVAAEHLFTSVLPFARYAGLDLSVEYTAYDDTLSYAGLGTGVVDVEFVWIDTARLAEVEPGDLADMVATRLEALRLLSDAPILVVNSGLLDDRGSRYDARLAERLATVPGAEIGDVTTIHRELGEHFLSSRRADLTAVPLSPAALVQVARRLGSSWLPALIRPTLKGVAIDLDNTLYAGVLGEDGIDGLELTDGHRAVQQRLHDLHDAGVFLAVVSRNEAEDVAKLFDAREDFPLRADDVDVWEVSWGQKSEAVTRAAAQLRVSADALLFLDDNPGEVVEVLQHSACTSAVLAADPELSANGLLFAPGMFRFASSSADQVRVRDLRSEQERAALRAAAADPQEYLRSLGVRLTFHVDQAAELPRAAELSRKTNQFTTALARLDETQLADRMHRADAGVITVGLRDRLSDSGSIAMVTAHRDGDTVVVDDICMSCRAMGRGLESVILNRALDDFAQHLGGTALRFDVTEGPRNMPARTWLDTTTGGTGRVIGRPAVDDTDPVEVEWIR